MKNTINQNIIVNKCQIFTPDKYANELLDYAGYKENLYGKKILENSCGDGQILKVIVLRYIQDSIKKNLSLKEIKKGIENDIYGVEIDKVHFKNCIDTLNLLVKKYGIKNIKWNIFNENSLGKDWGFKFDYVVGNPPYIAYRDLDTVVRDFLKHKYNSCKKGRFDYCYSFIEEGITSLKEDGKFAYIIPNSIFKNVFAQELRNILLPIVTKIIDFKSKRVFKNALTTTAFLICKNSQQNQVNYVKYINKEENRKFNILKENLNNRKWIFSENIDNINKKKPTAKRFGDYFHAAMGVATLHNKTFVIKNFIHEDENYIYLLNGYKLEKNILKYGASPLGLKNKKKEYIIFPYQYIDQQLKKITEKDLENLFPETTNYLKSQKEFLLKRSLEKNIKWFEYGKTQALQYLNRDKIVLSSLITNQIKSYYLNSQYIPYSGIYIITKADIPLERAKEILESSNFFEYIKEIGKNANGKTLKITAKDINNYYF